MDKELSILGVEDDGMILELSDGSRWNVRVGDSTKSACWYETQHVVVSKSTDPSYPHRIKNLDTSSQEQVAACPE